VKLKPWQLLDPDPEGNVMRDRASPVVQVKIEPSEALATSDFEEVWIDGSDPVAATDVSSSKASNDVVVYMCSMCKTYFPLKRMLETHKVRAHGEATKAQQPRRLCPDDKRIFYVGYHKVKSGQYVCNYCPFRSFARLTVSLHATREHSTRVEGTERCRGSDRGAALKLETLEEDDEDSWPMEVVEEPEEAGTAEEEVQEQEEVEEVDGDGDGDEEEEEEEEDEEEEEEEEGRRKSDCEDVCAGKRRTCPYCSFATTNSSTFHSHVKRKHRGGYLKSGGTTPVSLERGERGQRRGQRRGLATPRRAALRAHVLKKQEPRSSCLAKKKPDLGGQVSGGLAGPREARDAPYGDSEEEAPPVADGAVAGAVGSEAGKARKSRKCPLCPFESWIRSTMQSHVARYHRGGLANPDAAPRRVLQLPPMTGVRRLPNAQLYTGYACHYCTFVAATVASINSHTGREHQGQKQPIKEVPVTEYDCDQCDYKSRNRRNMQLHVKRCHTAQANAEGMFACHACSYETLSRMGLKRHISIKHNKTRRDAGSKGDSHECEQCDFKCLNGKTMDWHKRQHSAPPNAEDDGNSYFCNDCDFSTWTKGQLYLHIKRKHRDAEGNSRDGELEPSDHLFACEQCDYTSKNKHVMKVHVIRKHTNEYNHECEICGKKYKIKADLTNHVRFQHREQPIICDVCGKTCRNSNLLYLHQKFAFATGGWSVRPTSTTTSSSSTSSARTPSARSAARSSPSRPG
jgi:hypothetical protein